MNIEMVALTTSGCDQERLISLADYSLNAMGIHPDSELSISIVDVEEMSSLHMQWMDEPGPTDVLSFPMDELKPNSATSGPGILGDIVLCPDFAVAQAQVAGHSLQEELELLTVHGVLHLLGFDHRDTEERNVMFSKQDELLSSWRSKK
ncbi:MAG: rRNA maturation RNase YbeY [Actinomycetales bacterium]|jgi:probable rRNA maturation factor